MAEKMTLGKAPDPVAVLRAHRSSVNAVAFHPSNRLLSGDTEGELKIWDVGRRRVVSSSRVHSPAAGVVGIGASDYLDDKVLSQGRDGTVKCWKLLNDGLSREPVVHFSTNSYHFCKLSPLRKSTVPGISEIGPDFQDTSGPEVPSEGIPSNNSLVAVAGEEAGVAEIWDIDSGRRVQRLCESTSPGMCMALQLFAPPGAQATLNLIAGYEDGSMALWDLRTIKAPCFVFRFHQEPVLSVCVDASCRSGISGAADNKTVFFELDQMQGSCTLRKEIVHGRPGVSDVAVRCDNRICATGGWDHRVRVYDYLRVRPLAVLKYHSSTVTGVAFSKDNKILASSSRDSCIALWSIYPAT